MKVQPEVLKCGSEFVAIYWVDASGSYRIYYGLSNIRRMDSDDC